MLMSKIFTPICWLLIPRVKSAAGVWKLNSKALFDRERLRELQTGYGEALAPLGIRRAEPGSQAVHSEVRQFYGAVNASKSRPDRVKLPPAPKAPEPHSGMAAGTADALGFAFGMQTQHQRAMKAHAQAMRQWRETCKELRQQDAQAWDRMKAHSALAPLAQRCQRPAATPSTPSPSKPAPKNLTQPKPR
jgi:hypothetical protein